MTAFEGLMGNTCNLRVIEYLLPFTNAKFNETDLMEEVGVSKPTMIAVIRKLVEFGIIQKVDQKRNSTYYQVNKDSPFIRLFRDLNNLIIDHMYGEGSSPKSKEVTTPRYISTSTQPEIREL